MIHHGSIIAKRDKLTAISCKACGFIHLDPLPTVKQQREYYELEFYQVDKAGWKRENEEDAAWSNDEYAYELSYFDKPKDGDVLLDVGAGFGDFVRLARATGWNAVGLEPSPYACEVMCDNDIPHVRGFLEDTPIIPKSVKALRAAWVLEHVIDPTETLHRFHNALADDGQLMLIVPNDFTDIQWIVVRQMGKPFYWLHDSHLNYFSLLSLTALLKRTGFDVRCCFTTWPMELFLLMGHDYLANPWVGRRVHGWRKEMERVLMDNKLGLQVLAHMRGGLAAAGMGRDLVVVARKEK